MRRTRVRPRSVRITLSSRTSENRSKTLFLPLPVTTSIIVSVHSIPSFVPHERKLRMLRVQCESVSYDIRWWTMRRIYNDVLFFLFILEAAFLGSRFSPNVTFGCPTVLWSDGAPRCGSSKGSFFSVLESFSKEIWLPKSRVKTTVKFAVEIRFNFTYSLVI